MAPKAATSSLSDREMELLRNYHRCVKSKPEVDFEKFTTLSGFGNMASARSNLSRLLSKLSADPETTGNASPVKGAGTEVDEAAPDTPVTGKKKGGARKRKADAAEGDATEESPSKKKASATKRKGKSTTNTANEEQESSIKEEVDEGAGSDA